MGNTTRTEHAEVRTALGTTFSGDVRLHRSIDFVLRANFTIANYLFSKFSVQFLNNLEQFDKMKI